MEGLASVHCMPSSSSFEGDGARVLILGGTGRVGTSTARALSKLCPTLHLSIAGRNRDKGEQLLREFPQGVEFVELDIDDMPALRSALDGVDLVVHAAGPFQRREQCSVLEAAILSKTAYVDVCDDREYSIRAKELNEKAKAANVCAITTAGIYPGVSNVMAAELVRLATTESNSGIGSKPDCIRFFYFTAGSGGAGPTILATSFLLLGEEVVAYKKGERLVQRPFSGQMVVDFGKGVGKRSVYLLNLPEVSSIHEVLGVPSVSARFGTSPVIWNWAMAAVANLVPQEYLNDRTKVDALVRLSDPFVRALDGIVGELMSIRVDLDCTDGRKAVGLLTHSKLSVSVGMATAAFAIAILEGSTQPGVWFPEEPQGIAVEARQFLLQRAAEGSLNFMMNRAPWMIEENPKEIGFGIFMQ